jgi:hypothetical protein
LKEQLLLCVIKKKWTRKRYNGKEKTNNMHLLRNLLTKCTVFGTLTCVMMPPPSYTPKLSPLVSQMERVVGDSTATHNTFYIVYSKNVYMDVCITAKNV